MPLLQGLKLVFNIFTAPTKTKTDYFIYIYMKGVFHIMKIVCNKTDLLKGVNIVLKAVPSKTTMSILECILIDASAQKIKLTANDMELGIETVIEGDILEKGIVAIDAKIFSEIVRKLPDNYVAIETNANFQTKITCEKAKFNISGKSGEDFSYLPYIEKEDHISISQFSLKEIIKQTIFSISDNENNKMMTGELFELNDYNLKVVSLDGHRVSIRNLELKESYDSKKVIVPGKTLMEISKILSGEMDSFVNIFFTKNHIVFEFDETVVVSRLIEGEYFRIEQMLSNDYETKVQVNKKELLNCIDRATLLIKEGDKKPIIIEIGDGEMHLKITSGVGSMNEEIVIEKEGKDILIGFNPKFLIDALRVIDDEIITLYMVNPKAPCFIRDEEQSYIYLILPVNFNSAVN
jgi:DNA polymerase-3 subunit beta